MISKLIRLMNAWFTDPPVDTPQTDNQGKGDRDKPIKPKKRI